MRNKKKNKKKKRINQKVRLAENTVLQMDKIYLANLEDYPDLSREEYEKHRRRVYATILRRFGKRTPAVAKLENPFYAELIVKASSEIQSSEANLAGILSAKQWSYASDSHKYASIFMKIFYFYDECEEE